MRSFLITASLLALAPVAAQAQPAASPPAAPADDAVYTCDLMPRWGRAVTPENAWRLYTHPPMARDRWLTLNGLWASAIAPPAAALPAGMDGQIPAPPPIKSHR